MTGTTASDATAVDATAVDAHVCHPHHCTVTGGPCTRPGMISAVLDCDADSIEAFNRWYDLEHVPPNVSLTGVMSGRRYAAPPELHALRITDPSSPLAGGRGSFVTVYTLCQPPAEVVASMAELREVLYDTGRMRFPAEKKVVRDGGAFELVSAVSSPDLALPAIDVPFVGHHGVLMVRRRGGGRGRRLVSRGVVEAGGRARGRPRGGELAVGRRRRGRLQPGVPGGRRGRAHGRPSSAAAPHRPTWW